MTLVPPIEEYYYESAVVVDVSLLGNLSLCPVVDFLYAGRGAGRSSHGDVYHAAPPGRLPVLPAHGDVDETALPGGGVPGAPDHGRVHAAPLPQRLPGTGSGHLHTTP